MGAAQTFQWTVAYPDIIKVAVPFCGAARTAHHNITFLRSLVMALELDPKFKGGDYAMDEQPQGGKGVFAAIYSSWGASLRTINFAELKRCCVTGFSQAFYRQELFKELGYPTRDDFLEKFWAPLFAHKDALNLRHMLRTWIAADIVRIFPTCDAVFLTLGPADLHTRPLVVARPEERAVVDGSVHRGARFDQGKGHGYSLSHRPVLSRQSPARLRLPSGALR